MALLKVIDRKRGIVTSTAGGAGTFVTIISVNLVALLGGSGENAGWGARMRAVFKNIGSNQSYAGFAEWCAGGYVDFASTVAVNGQVSGNGNAYGLVGSPGVMNGPFCNFAVSGSNLLAQVSNLDADSWKWFADLEIWGYTTS